MGSWVLLAFSSALAIVCLVFSLSSNLEYGRWRVDRPLEAVVDLSRPGLVAATLKQECPYSLCNLLYLDCDELETKTDDQLKTLFRDFAATLVIKDGLGNEVERLTIGPESVENSRGQVRLVKKQFGSYSPGNYRATFKVTKALPAVAGQRQVLHIQYSPDNLVLMPAAFATLLGAVAGLVALILGVSKIYSRFYSKTG